MTNYTQKSMASHNHNSFIDEVDLDPFAQWVKVAMYQSHRDNTEFDSSRRNCLSNPTSLEKVPYKKIKGHEDEPCTNNMRALFKFKMNNPN